LGDPATLNVSNVTKEFKTPYNRVEVLRGVTLALQAGESLAITGPSGSGKSTLLHLIGTLEEPTSGTITLDGKNPFDLGEAELARFRNRTIGFIFQEHHLLPQYSVLENVLIPTMAFPAEKVGKKAGEKAGEKPAEKPADKPEDRARELLDRVGLDHRLDHRPAELSGGERQRVAVARALINEPRLLLCDEPTGSLDPSNAAGVAELLMELHQAEATILILVTHSLDLARLAGRQLELREGTCSAA
jgi:lipoprotein-releasing system ATP-binding protein